METFARKGYIFDFNMLTKNFENLAQFKTFPNRFEPFFRDGQVKTCSILPQIEADCLVFGVQAHLSNYTGIIFRIWAPFFKLKSKLSKHNIHIVFS